MVGYIFETTNTKTGETYIGKRYAVTFDKNYLGESDNEDLAKDIEKYGRPAFSVRMLMPYENTTVLDASFAGLNKKPAKTKKEAEPVEEVEEAPVEEKKPTRKKKAVEEE